jgi:hypothetical protein
MNKKHLIGYPVAVILALTIGAAGASGSSTATTAAESVPAVTVTGPAPAPVTQAPAECGTAIDGAAKFATAVGAEHGAMGAAFTKAGSTGDVVTMTAEITAAVNTLNAEMKADSPAMIAAAQVCRAAIK